jgi:hypothetical protein
MNNPSRRSFLKTSAAALAAATVLPSLMSAAPVAKADVPFVPFPLQVDGPAGKYRVSLPMFERWLTNPCPVCWQTAVDVYGASRPLLGDQSYAELHPRPTLTDHIAWSWLLRVRADHFVHAEVHDFRWDGEHFTGLCPYHPELGHRVWGISDQLPPLPHNKHSERFTCLIKDVIPMTFLPKGTRYYFWPISPGLRQNVLAGNRFELLHLPMDLLLTITAKPPLSSSWWVLPLEAILTPVD